MKNFMICFITTVMICLSSHLFAESEYTISAPIFPKIDILYQYEGDNYPDTLAEKIDISQKAFLTFPDVFDCCHKKLDSDPELFSLLNDPKLFIEQESKTLTQEELANNYKFIAECAYVLHSSKPYFIPQLVEDVDICDTLLSNETTTWRMISDDDISQWTDDFYSQLSTILNPTNLQGWDQFYYSLVTYIKTPSGLKIANLHNGINASERIIALPGNSNGINVSKYHQEAVELEINSNGDTELVPITLRCIN